MRRATVAVLASLVLVGCGGGGEPPSEIEVTGTDELTFDPAEMTAAAGEVTVEFSAVGSRHSFVIEELGDEVVVAADVEQTETGTVELEPGTYTVYCDVATHRQNGMVATLTVE